MSIVDKLTYLNTTKQLLKTEINKINNVLTDESTFRSYPQELFNGYLDILNNGTDTLWNNLEKVSASGETPVLENVETAPIKMVLNGNTSQDGEPTPDTPVEVKVVKGENVVSVQGKNLTIYPYANNGNKNGITFTSNNDGTILLNGKNNGNANSSYNIYNNSNNPMIIEAGTYYIIPPSNTGITYVMYDGKSYYNFGVNNNYSHTFSTQVSIKIFYVQVLKGNETTFENEKIYPMLSKSPNQTIDNYVPYSKTDYPINLGNIELCKINTYKDYFYKDSGKWYVHKEITKKVFSGIENLAYSGSASTPTERTTVRWNFQDYINLANYFSNRFVYNSQSSNRIVLVVNSKTVYISTDNTITGINVEDDEGTKVSKIKNWLSNNNVSLYCVLATPTETEITNSTLIEQLEAIYRAKSVKDKTYITQTNDELPFILDVEAIKEYSVE